MSRHEHHDCAHSVRYCKTCDAVYCTACHREWRSQWISYTPYAYTSTTTGAVAPTWNTKWNTLTGGAMSATVGAGGTMPAHTHE